MQVTSVTCIVGWPLAEGALGPLELSLRMSSEFVHQVRSDCRPPDRRSGDRTAQVGEMDVAYQEPWVVPSFGQMTTSLPWCVTEFMPVDVILP
jgi:hypothetical protein